MTPAPSQDTMPTFSPTHHMAAYRWRRSQLPSILLRDPKRIKVKQEPIVVVIADEEDSNNEIIVIEDD